MELADGSCAAHNPAFPFEVLNRPGRPSVTRVFPDKGGDAGGLKLGDTIVRIEGHSVDDIYYALHLSRVEPPGSPVHLEVDRDGQIIDVTIRSDPAVLPLPANRVLILSLFVVSWGVILLIFWRRPRDPVAIPPGVHSRIRRIFFTTSVFRRIPRAAAL